MDTIQIVHPNFLDSLREYIETEVSRVLRGHKETTQPIDEYLTIRQVCQYLKVTAPTLWEWSNKGVLNKLYISGQPRYKKSEIDSVFIKMNKKK